MKIIVIAFTSFEYDGRVQKELITIDSYLNCKITLVTYTFSDFSKYTYNFHFLKRGKTNSPLLNLLRLFTISFKLQKKLHSIKTDIIHCNDLDTLLLGVIYKQRNKGVHLIYDAHELYAEKQEQKINRIIWHIIEKLLIKKPDWILIPEEQRANYLISKYNLINDKVLLLPNYPLDIRIDEALEYKYDILRNNLGIASDKKIILYIGPFGEGRKNMEMLKSLKYVISKKVVMVFLGYSNNNDHFVNELKEVIKYNNWQNKVFFHPPVKNDQISYYMKCADIGLVFYHNNTLNGYYAASNKLYEFVELGVPVVTNNYPGLYKDIALNELGICIDFVDPESIGVAINDLLSKRILKPPRKYLWSKYEKNYLTALNNYSG